MPIEDEWRLRVSLNRTRRSVKPRLLSRWPSTSSVSSRQPPGTPKTSSAVCQTKTRIMRYLQLQFARDKMAVLIQHKLPSTGRSTGSLRCVTHSQRSSQVTRMATPRPTSPRIPTLSTFTRAKTTLATRCRTSTDLTRTRWTSWRSILSLCSRLRTCAPRDEERRDH